MAHPNTALIEGLRKAAAGLVNGNYYAWGHHGACNCGHLLQATTTLSKEEIVTHAHTGIGEWTELAQESCPVTNAPINLLLKKLAELGLTPTDIHNIETMANMLEEKLINQIEVNYSELLPAEEVVVANGPE